MRFFRRILLKLAGEETVKDDLKEGQARLSQQFPLEHLLPEGNFHLKEGQAWLSQQLSGIIDGFKEEKARHDELLASNHELIEEVVTVLAGVDTRLERLEKARSEEQKIKFVESLLPVMDALYWAISAMTERITSAENEPPKPVDPEKHRPKRRRPLSSGRRRRKKRQGLKLNKGRKKRRYSYLLRKRLSGESKDNKIAEELKVWLEGMQMIQARALDILAKFNVRRIPAEGEVFNPHLHKAVGVQEGPDVEDNRVVREELPGYILNNTVIRYAEVVVGSKVAEPEPEREPEPEPEPEKEKEEEPAEVTDKRATWPPPKRFWDR